MINNVVAYDRRPDVGAHFQRQVAQDESQGNKMSRGDEPYAVIALDERDFDPHERHELSLSLTMAFLLSARLRFHFQMSEDVSREVDRVFDQALRYLPMESKGVVYRKDLRCEGKICLLI
jgi:hypothetical protein